ncbi:hypothetical protein FKM82_011383 [Ascaphus truei]
MFLPPQRKDPCVVFVFINVLFYFFLFPEACAEVVDEKNVQRGGQAGGENLVHLLWKHTHTQKDFHTLIHLAASKLGSPSPQFGETPGLARLPRAEAAETMSGASYRPP